MIRKVYFMFGLGELKSVSIVIDCLRLSYNVKKIKLEIILRKKVLGISVCLLMVR